MPGQLPAQPPLVLPVGPMARARSPGRSGCDGPRSPWSAACGSRRRERRRRAPAARSPCRAARSRRRCPGPRRTWASRPAGPSRRAGRAPPDARTPSPRIARTSGRLHDWIDGRPISRTTATRDATDAALDRLRSSARTPRRARRPPRPRSSWPTRAAQITEVRTGPQVAWMMARGYEGAFGRAITRPAIWIALCALFLCDLPFLRPRRLLSLADPRPAGAARRSASRWSGSTGARSSPRCPSSTRRWSTWACAWPGSPCARPRGAPARGRRRAGRRARRRAAVPDFARLVPDLAAGHLLAVALALRFGLNAFDSNVIDVGYAGVIGADRIEHGAHALRDLPERLRAAATPTARSTTSPTCRSRLA